MIRAFKTFREMLWRHYTSRYIEPRLWPEEYPARIRFGKFSDSLED